MKGCTTKNNFDSRKLNHLIKLQSAIRWDYSTFEKMLQNIFTIWMSFQLLLQLGLYNLLLHSQKRQTTCSSTCEGNLMHPSPPPSPPGTRKGQQRQIPHEILFFPEKLRFLILDTQFELFNNNYTTGKIILYLVKHLDSVVIHFTHNYPSITKIC